MRFLARVIVSAIAIWLTSLLLGSHLEVVGGQGAGGQVVVVLVIALIFTVINAFIKPVVQFFALPLYILTLGLFTFVVNALMVMLTAWITESADWGLRVDGFWWAVLAAIIISFLSTLVSPLFAGSRPPRR